MIPLWVIIILLCIILFVLKSVFSKKPDPESWEKKDLLPHQSIRQLDDNLWEVTGSLPYPLPRNMTVFRIPDSKDLILHSVIALSEEGMKELEKIGTPKICIVPSGFHTMDIKRFKKRYVGIKVFCPKEIRSSVEKVTSVDGNCEDELPKYGINCRVPLGLKKPTELVYEFPLNDDNVAVVLCDLLFNFPIEKSPFLLRLLGSGGFFGVTRIGRWFILKDKKEFAAFLTSLAEELGESLKIITMAHGDVIKESCAVKLVGAANRLL